MNSGRLPPPSLTRATPTPARGAASAHWRPLAAVLCVAVVALAKVNAASKVGALTPHTIFVFCINYV